MGSEKNTSFGENAADSNGVRTGEDGWVGRVATILTGGWEELPLQYWKKAVTFVSH